MTIQGSIRNNAIIKPHPNKKYENKGRLNKLQLKTGSPNGLVILCVINHFHYNSWSAVCLQMLLICDPSTKQISINIDNCQLFHWAIWTFDVNRTTNFNLFIWACWSQSIFITQYTMILYIYICVATPYIFYGWVLMDK